MKYSKKVKLNTVFNQIEEQLKCLELPEIAHYIREFPYEPDYNIAQYGNVLVAYQDVRMMYINAGYKSVMEMPDSFTWEIYKRHVGYVARELVKTAAF